MIRQIFFGIAIAIASMGLSACGAEPARPKTAAAQAMQPTVPFEPMTAPAKPESSKPAPKKESSQPAGKSAAPDSGTAEEVATKRAADPKDPSGALIIEKPGATRAKP